MYMNAKLIGKRIKYNLGTISHMSVSVEWWRLEYT